MLWSGFLVTGNTTQIAYSLSHPAEFQGFVFMVFLLAMASIAIVAGMTAVVQNRRGQAAAPRALAAALSGLAGVCLGAVLVAAVALRLENADGEGHSFDSTSSMSTR